MAKLYPPYLEGTLPAFCLDLQGDGNLIIPFAHNKAVSQNEIGGIAVKVKTVQNDVLITDFISKGQGPTSPVTFRIENWKYGDWTLKIGQYYKIQLAYIDENDVQGYFSTVGVIKCTSKPNVYIEGFDKNKVNKNNTEFIGRFEQPAGGDVTEKVYSSNFIITDLYGNEIKSTGTVLHDVQNNPNSYSSIDTMLFNRDLNFGEIYKIKYLVTTTNGLEISSPEYLLTQQKSLNMELKGSLKAELNYEDGYVDISIVGYVDESGVEEIGNGTFVLAREDSLNSGIWDELYRFALKYESPTKTIFRDFTIEQGKTYTYSIQQYNTNRIYSDRKKSNAVYADFEDMFLYDGEQQLKLEFNPQVASFKTQLAENRLETIGSKYPFFFRNAAVGYKTFPISGLLSMLTDNQQFFNKFDDILREDFIADRHDITINRKQMPEVYNHISLLSQNITSERLFKLNVLDWMNNGKVKLFKSPGEGNYLVRVMETSLTPQDALGRMLHTVNTTAYECAEFNHSNMVKYGIVEDTSEEQLERGAYVTNWREESVGSYTFSENINGGLASENLLKADVDNIYTTNLRFTDFVPGTKIKLVFAPTGVYDSEDVDCEIIVIGATGNYYADDIQPVYGIYLINDSGNSAGSGQLISATGTVTYQYEVPARNTFDSISSIDTDIGAYANFVGEVKNLVQSVENTREQLTKVSMSNYFKRPVEFLYYPAVGDEIYTSSAEIEQVLINSSGYYRNYIGPTLYWDSEFDPDEIFDDKESMEYSPYSLYVIRNPFVNGENYREYFVGKNAGLFEQYYLDRYLSAQTAEDILTECSSLWSRYISLDANSEDAIALKEVLDKMPVYVLDAWHGYIYKVGERFIYNPSVALNGENIDLREIERYSLDDLDSDNLSISVGNGVYGQIFYQKVIITYTFEGSGENTELINIKKDWEDAQEAVNEYMKTEPTSDAESYMIGLQQLIARADRLYATYNSLLAQAIAEWTSRGED